jgi:hypothetical protein
VLRPTVGRPLLGVGSGVDAPGDFLDVLGRRPRCRKGRTGGRRERACRRVAVLRLLGHPLRDDGVELGPHSLLDSAHPRRARVEVGIHERGQVVAAKWLLRGEALEEHARERVHVGAWADRVALEPLRSHVVEGAERGADHREPRAGVPHRVRDAEVHDVDEFVGRDEDVARLDVAVHHPVGVGGVERLGDLGDEVDGALRRHRATLGDQGPEIRSVDKAHVDEQPVVDFAVVVDWDDMRFA